MRVNREQVARNRERILEAASRLFRERGFDGVGVDAVMKEAGLTHGGFYGHFASKEDLVTQACAHGFTKMDEPWAAARDPLAALAAAYLAEDHCEQPGEGCLLPTLGSDIARQGGGVRQAYTEFLRERIDRLTTLLPGRSKAARRRQAIATWAGLVGAMMLARAVDDPALSAEIRKAGIATFGKSPSGAAGRAGLTGRSG